MRLESVYTRRQIEIGQCRAFRADTFRMTRLAMGPIRRASSQSAGAA